MPRVLLPFQENNKERKTNIHIYTSNYEDTPYLIKEFIYGHLIFSSGFGWSYTNTVSHENIYNYLHWIPGKRIFFSIFGEIHCNQLVSVFMIHMWCFARFRTICAICARTGKHPRRSVTLSKVADRWFSVTFSNV